MPIGPITMTAIFLTIWWTVLFCVLPLGMSQEDQAPPTDGGPVGRAEDAQSQEEIHHHHLGLGDRLGRDHGHHLHRLAAAAETRLKKRRVRLAFAPSRPG
jgi:hypothetical protein